MTKLCGARHELNFIIHVIQSEPYSNKRSFLATDNFFFFAINSFCINNPFFLAAKVQFSCSPLKGRTINENHHVRFTSAGALNFQKEYSAMYVYVLVLNLCK